MSDEADNEYFKQIRKIIEDRKKANDLKLEKTSHPFILENCPECGANAVLKELGIWVGQPAKRGTPDSEGIVKVTCRVCEHIWYEDEMVRKIVNETTIS